MGISHFYKLLRNLALLAACAGLATAGASDLASADPVPKGKASLAAPSKARVRAVKGNIVLTRGGQDTRLTSSGLDAEPTLSHDGSRIAFVRTVKGVTINTASDEIAASEIWIANTDSTAVRRLVTYTAHVDKSEDMLADFSNLRFSLDGKTLYFASTAWVTSGALKSVDLTTDKVRHLSPANGFELLTRGKYKHHFVSYQHKYTDNGVEDNCWLLSPDGKELREVGEDLAECAKRLEKE